jgi:DNA-binding transcriptional MerR regulator
VATGRELIEAREVAEILKLSIPSLRDYKKRGLIKIAAKQGNKDLYDKADVVWRCSIIAEKRGEGFSLSQISSMLAKDFINPPGLQVPQVGMSGDERIHGFLDELYRGATPKMKAHVDELRRKWNVHVDGAE